MAQKTGQILRSGVCPHRKPRALLRGGEVLVVCLPRGGRRVVPALPLGVAPEHAPAG
jgi:hypothetical protein